MKSLSIYWLALVAGTLFVFAPLNAQFSMDRLRETAENYAKEASGVELPEGLTQKLGALASSFGWRDRSYTQLAGDAVRAFNDGKSLDALGSLNKLGSSRLTPGQMELFKEAKLLADVYVLEKDFADAGTAARGPLANSLRSIRSGDYATAVPQLQQLREQAELSSEQTEVLNGLVNQYQEWAETQEDDS